MKCPQCQAQISVPGGNDCCVNGVDVVVVTCPHCQTVLGVVQRSHSAYLRRCNATPSRVAVS